jgi:hypothetical protein
MILFDIPVDYYYALALLLSFSLLSYHYYNSQPFLKTELQSQVKPKYEDKYLKEYRELVDDSTIFTEEELENERMYGMEYKQRCENTIKNDIQNLKDEITLYKEKYYLITGKNYDSEEIKEEEKEEDDDELTEVLDFINHYSNQLNKLEEKSIIPDEVVFEISRKNTLINRRKNLVNNYVMEYTPLGNIIMRYNPDRESFEYYADNTIPYRFLEVVGRKYVITFNCKSIFVNMEDELKNYELKLLEQEQKEQEEQKEEKEVKKNVFAKFKNYNKGTTSGPVAAPPKNNNIPIPKGLAKIIDQYSSKDKSEEKSLLKDRANRYSCEGKIIGFNMLKKVKKELVDSRAKLTFSDFKRLKKEQ